MKKIDYCDTETIRSYIEQYGYNEYNCNVVTLLMWKDVYELYYEAHEHFFVGYWLYHNRIRWIMPLCKEEHLKEAIDYMIKYSNEHDFDFVIEAAVQPFIDRLRNTYDRQNFICRLEENAGDYVYDLQMHATLQGKKMQKRRNHYNAFIKEYDGRYEFKNFELSMQEEVLAFLEKWKDSHEYKEDIEAEITGIKGLFAHYKDFNLMGGCIYIDNKLEAFTLASKLYPDTLQIHVEKANREIRGLYVAILKSFLNEHLEYKYINREDDLGIPELRKAKMDLHPVYRLKKYAIGLNEAKLIHPKEEHLEDIKQLWLDSFSDEDENSTNFYFNHLYSSNYTYAIECRGSILAAMQIKPMIISVAGEAVETHFIVGVCTRYNFRGNGFMRWMMEKALADYGNDKLIILQAYNWDIYKPFDFKPMYFQNVYSVKDKFKDIGKIVYNTSKDVRAEELLKVYQEFTTQYVGYRLRDIQYYLDYFIPYHQNENNTILSIQDNVQCIIGYLVYSILDDKIIISECIINDVSIIKNIVNELLEETNCVMIHTPQNIDLLDEKDVIPNMAIRYNDSELAQIMNNTVLYINESL